MNKRAMDVQRAFLAAAIIIIVVLLIYFVFIRQVGEGGTRTASDISQSIAGGLK